MQGGYRIYEADKDILLAKFYIKVQIKDYILKVWVDLRKKYNIYGFIQATLE